MFSKGDYIVCIDNSETFWSQSITIGKNYQIYDIRYDLSKKYEISIEALLIEDDKGHVGIYEPNRFISLQQARQDKINKLFE